MITPILGSAYPPKPGWTTFHLRLAPSENGTDISAQHRILRPTLLLFLRQLRTLNITVKEATRYRTLKISREGEPEHDIVSLLMRLNGVELKVQRYLLVRKFAQTPTQEPERQGIERSEIVLAFPVTETGDAVIKTQDVHAFLPLRRYGFNVCLFRCLCGYKHNISPGIVHHTGRFHHFFKQGGHPERPEMEPSSSAWGY